MLWAIFFLGFSSRAISLGAALAHGAVSLGAARSMAHGAVSLGAAVGPVATKVKRSH